MQIVGQGLPVTHGVQAAREVVAGAPLADVAKLLEAEAAIGLGYLLAAFVLFRVFEFEGRRRATLETY
jgi:ABC-2 type transport system permease protein